MNLCEWCSKYKVMESKPEHPCTLVGITNDNAGRAWSILCDCRALHTKTLKAEWDPPAGGKVSDSEVSKSE